MTVSISPVWNGTQFFNNDGLPLNGGKIWQYQAESTSIEQNTYSDDTGSTANANPIVLDSSGRIPVEMYLTDGLAYNLVLTLNDGTTVLAYVDNVIGVKAASPGGIGGAVWNTITDTPSFVNITTLLIPNDYVAEFAIGNRVQVVYTGYSLYGTVGAVSYSSPNTQVVLVNDGASQNSGMTAILWSEATVAGPIVDAGAVTYTSSLTYSDPKSVGGQLKLLTAGGGTTNTILAQELIVQTTSGISPTYILTPSPASTSYAANQEWKVKFHAANVGVPTLNVSGLGAVSLKQYDAYGNKITPYIATGQVSDIFYDGTDMIVADALPPSASAGPTTTYVNVTYALGDTYTLPSNCIGIYVYGKISGASNRGARSGIQIYDGTPSLIATLPISGTNEDVGGDGGSGMNDSAGGYVPMSSAARSIKFVSILGTSIQYIFYLYAYTQFV